MRKKLGDRLVVFDGLRFVMEAKTGYYHAHVVVNGRDTTILLHRRVWESFHGPIPNGFHVHHKDHDRTNNSIENLELLSGEEHRRRHAEELSEGDRERMRKNLERYARPKACEWHRSEEGRAWHRKHAILDCPHERRYSCHCESCGKEFTGFKGQRFCSNACKSKWRRDRGLDDVQKTCVVCGNAFMTNKFARSSTCSRSCGNVIRARTIKARRTACA